MKKFDKSNQALEVFKKWLLIHRQYNLSGSIRDSRDLPEALIKAGIVIAYFSLSMGVIFFSVGVLKFLNIFQPATESCEMLSAFIITTFGILIIQTLHLSNGFFRLTENQVIKPKRK